MRGVLQMSFKQKATSEQQEVAKGKSEKIWKTVEGERKLLLLDVALELILQWLCCRDQLLVLI